MEIDSGWWLEDLIEPKRYQSSTSTPWLSKWTHKMPLTGGHLRAPRPGFYEIPRRVISDDLESVSVEETAPVRQSGPMIQRVKTPTDAPASSCNCYQTVGLRM